MIGKGDCRGISDGKVRLYDKVHKQIETFYAEIGHILKKKPSEPLNKFKLGLINQTVAKANELCGDEFREFPDFTVFDVEGDLPTAGDVIMMLAHYRKAMTSFWLAHSSRGQWNRPRPQYERPAPYRHEEEDEEQEEEGSDDEDDND